MSEAEFRSAAESHVAELEKAARNWPRTRWFILGLTLFVSLVAAVYLRGFWTTFDKPFDVVKRFEEIAVPKDVPPDLWFVGELRRAVALMQTHNRLLMLAMFQGVIGILLFFAAVWLGTYIVRHWSDGPKREVLALLARRQMELCFAAPTTKMQGEVTQA